MRVHQEDAICKDKIVKVVRQDTGETVYLCIWADDDEGAYEQIVTLPDGRIETTDGNRFSTRIVMAPIKIEIEDRPPPPSGCAYDSHPRT